MPRITIAAWGSLGDAAPAVALARALRERDVVVRLLVNPHFVALAAAAGVPASAIGRADLATWDLELTGLAMPMVHLERRTQCGVLRMMARDRDAIAASLREAAHDSDFVLTNGLLSEFHALLRNGGTRTGLWLSWPDVPPALRHHVGEGPLIVGCSALLLGTAEARSLECRDGHVGGYWRPPTVGELLPEETMAFLRELRPAVVTLGSAGQFWTDDYVDWLLDELQAADVPFLIQGRLTAGQKKRLGPNCHAAGLIDHAAVFPHSRFVLHQGGCGVVHAVAAAGVPAGVLPQWGDQAIWAAFLDRRGLSAGTISLHDRTKGAVTSLIQKGLADSALAVRCAAVARQMAATSPEIEAAAGAALVERLAAMSS